MTETFDASAALPNASANINFALLRAARETNPDIRFDILARALLELPTEINKDQIYSALMRIGFNQLNSLEKNDDPAFRSTWIISLNLIIDFIKLNATQEFKSDQRYISLKAQVKKLNKPIIPR